MRPHELHRRRAAPRQSQLPPAAPTHHLPSVAFKWPLPMPILPPHVCAPDGSASQPGWATPHLTPLHVDADKAVVPLPTPVHLSCHPPCPSSHAVCRPITVAVPALTGIFPRLGVQAAERRVPDARNCLKPPSSSFFAFCPTTPRASSHSHPPSYLLSVQQPLDTILVSTAAAKLPLSSVFLARGGGSLQPRVLVVSKS
jgi:hypothetical protein